MTTPLTGNSLIVGTINSSGTSALSSSGLYVIRPTTPAAVALSLPSSPVPGTNFTIKDGLGDAATFNITINGSGNTIDGSTTYVLSANYSGVTIAFSGLEWSVIGTT